MDQKKKFKLFNEISSKREEQLKYIAVQASCLFDIDIQKIETAHYLPVNDLKFCIQIRGNYMIEYDQNSQSMISALKLNYFVKFKTDYKENQGSSSNINFSLYINNVLRNFENTMQGSQSYFNQYKKYYLQTSDYISYKKFITVLFAKSVLQEVKDFRILFKPGKLLKATKTCKIYQGSSANTKEKIIVKAYSKQFLQQQNLLKSLLQQLNLLDSVRQPGIIKIKKVYCTQKTIYVILPHYHFNLATFNKIYGNKLSNAQAILEVVMKVLSNIHKREIVHRNVCSQHILVNQKNGKIIQAVVIGFDNCIDFAKIAQKIQQQLDLMIEETSQNKFEQQSSKDIEMAGKVLHQMIASKNSEQLFMQSSQPVDNKRNSNDFSNAISIPESALDLLNKMMEIQPASRIKSQQILQHDFFKEKYEIEQEKKNIKHVMP